MKSGALDAKSHRLLRGYDVVVKGDDLAPAAQSLRSVLDGIAEAPDVVPDPVLVAYLAGAANTLALVADGERPDANVSGQQEHETGPAE